MLSKNRQKTISYHLPPSHFRKGALVNRIVLLLFFLLVPPAVFAASPNPGDAAPSFSPTDVKDRTLSLPEAGHVMVLSFASKSTGESAGDLTRAIRVLHPEVRIFSFIDLSDFPGFMQVIVKSWMKARQEGAVKSARAAFIKVGRTPPDDLDSQIHIIPDFDASFCKAYGATDTEHQAHIVVVGADGKVKAVFAKTPSLDDLKAAVEKAVGAKQ